jgi:hypothetical protein
MKRFFAVLLLVCAAGPLSAQDAPEVIHLTVTANLAPVPALKYTLLPKVHDLQPGNAALLYYRSFTPEWWGDFQRQKREFWEKADAVRKLPLDKLKPTDLVIPVSPAALHEVDRAARRAYCDWEIAPRLAEEGIGWTVPDIQNLRPIMTFLAIRARQEMLAGNIDAAIYTFQTGLQMAKHAGEGESIISSLIGIAIGMIASGQLEEFMQLPHAPNLYWALSELPRPFVDLRKPLGGESLMIQHEFAPFRVLENGPVSPEEAQKAVDYLASRGPYWDNKTDATSIAADISALYPVAKQSLAASGTRAADIEKMPRSQVVMLYSLRQVQWFRDERAKWMILTYVEGREGLQRVDEEAKRLADKHEAMTFVTLYGSALNKVKLAQVRIDRKIAILRCVEAIKLHAAETGKFPATLSDIKTVPVPFDPMVNKPFEYLLKGDTAIVTAPLYGNFRGNGWQYEIKLAAPATPK